MVLLVGTRSSLVVDFEETCRRCERDVSAAVSFHDVGRLIDPSKSIAHTDFDADASTSFIPCAFSPDRRQFYFDWAVGKGLSPAAALIDPFAAVAASGRVGSASFLNAGAVVGALCLLGEGVLMNRNSSVGHHSFIGDFVSIGPGATLASNAQVGQGAVIGAGATVLPNIKIGAGAVISAGTVVRSHVEENMLVFGSPAKQKRHNKARSTLMNSDEE